MFFYCPGLFPTKKIKKPLQVRKHYSKRDKRASLRASNRGFASVEAAIVLPILICALCGMLMWCKVLLLNQEMEAALLETGRQLARKEYLFTSKEREGGSVYGVDALFRKNLGQADRSSGMEVSGLSFMGTEYDGRTKELHLKLSYQVTLPVFLLGNWKLRLSAAVDQKAWNGYAPAKGEKSGGDDSEYVYITEDGEVYHSDGQCYHLHVTIHETENTAPYYDGQTSYRPCEYCIQKGQERASVLYIPEEGDCYHSDPSCSGLTRTVRYVPRESIGNMRPCKDCCQ